MEKLCRCLLLPSATIFSGCNDDAESWHAAALHDESTVPPDNWNLFLTHFEAFLKDSGIQFSSVSVEHLASQIALFCNNSYQAGFKEGVRQSANRQAEKARLARLERADERGRIVRQAISAVCTQQKVTPTASVKFAASIQAEVIQAARLIGLIDVKNGMSPRSLQRHIVALLKSERPP